jgi:hypothetical protein
MPGNIQLCVIDIIRVIVQGVSKKREQEADKSGCEIQDVLRFLCLATFRDCRVQIVRQEAQVNQDSQENVYAGTVDHAERGGSRAASQVKKGNKFRASKCTNDKQKAGCTDHSSVSHSQARSYFNSNEGSVPTTAYRRPRNTHAFSWYGVWAKAFFPAISQVQACSQKKKRVCVKAKEEQG